MIASLAEEIKFVIKLQKKQTNKKNKTKKTKQKKQKKTYHISFEYWRHMLLLVVQRNFRLMYWIFLVRRGLKKTQNFTKNKWTY